MKSNTFYFLRDFATNMKMTTIAAFIIALLQVVAGQDGECSQHLIPDKSSNPCRTKNTCHECIAADRCCAWCTKKEYTEERCGYFFEIKINCNNSYMFPMETFLKLKDKKLSKKGDKEEDIVQIKPQEVSIKLKPNVPFSLNIEYKQAEDYPVDLYYLMDLSNSMADDKTKLADLGDTLAANMKKITSKFQLGFGSFVEKLALPYLNTHPDKINEPCEGCAAPYTFHNNMPLNRDTDRFKEEVNRAKTAGNFDAPEAGFDALMQAIVCKAEINWRENSRKLLVLTTDAGYHYAGDGKLAGIVRPNDGNCHLNVTGYYSEGTNQDYPSVSQIRKAILKHKINVIFAVTRSQLFVFGNLSRELDGSSIGELKNDSSNVVNLIQNQYNKITSSLKLAHNSTDPVKITYFSSCLTGIKRKTSTCDDIGVGGSVTFEARIEVTSCPKDKTEWNQTFQIYPVDLNEAVTVHLEMICECDCEKSWNEESASDYCTAGNGTYECGICTCNKNRSGKKCECDSKSSDTTTVVHDTAACFKANDTTECSGKGKCFCGRCECFPHENPEHKTTGQFCDCDNFSCDRHNTLLCGGSNQGICECGKCKCLPGWIGKACECYNTNETCIKPGDEKLCSGHGQCECGECSCRQTEEERYSGKFCDKCLVCPGSCKAYKTCVQCKIFQSGPLNKEQCQNCTGNYKGVTDLPKNGKECYFDDDDGCRFIFTYMIEEGDLVTINVKKNKECPKPVNALAIGLGVTGRIVAIGIATVLIWKLLTFLYDNREYVKFVNEQKLARWNAGDNPLYKQATLTFQNPSFGNTDQ